MPHKSESTDVVRKTVWAGRMAEGPCVIPHDLVATVCLPELDLEFRDIKRYAADTQP